MSLETKIYLVRHGQTEWNKQIRLQGHKNSPLTENGIQQASAARKILQDIPIDNAFVSPLKRARDTIDLILENRKLDIAIRDNLKEINLGPWEGKTRQEVKLSHPDEYLAFCEKADAFNLSGAETFQDLQSRMVEELEIIFTKGKNKNNLVVSHWIAIKVALAHYSSTPLSHLSEIANPENGGVLCLSKKGDDIFIGNIL